MSENTNRNNSIDPQPFEFKDAGAMDIEFDFSAAPGLTVMEAGPFKQDLYQFLIDLDEPLFDFANNTAPTHGLHADISTQASESASQTSPRQTNSFLSEQELAAQKEYLDNYGFSHTTNMTDLASQISRDLDQRQRERLLDAGGIGQKSLQSPVLAYGGDVTSSDLAVATERIALSNQYRSPPSTVENYYMSPSLQTLGLQYASKAYDTVQLSHDSLDQLITPAQQSGSLPLDTVSQSHPRPTITGLDALIIRAQKSTDQKQNTPSTRGGCLTTKSELSKKPKAKKKSQPTPMQCAPLSVSAEPNEKRVNIDMSADGIPRVIMREGEDPNQPISLAECVARPRDEQLTRPRDGEPPIQRVRINSRRSRPPYLPLEEGMAEEELLRRAMRNQEISELDRLDRRTRNNESARRTRERTKKTIADQAETIEQQNLQIQTLHGQVAERQQEIYRLQAELDQERGAKNIGGVNSLFVG